MRISRYLRPALQAALVVAFVGALFGCSGEMQFDDGSSGGSVGSGSSVPVTMTLAQDTDIGCWTATLEAQDGATLPEIDQSSVEEAMTVADGDGNEITVAVRWNDAGDQVTLCGPLKYCTTYTLSIAEGVIKDSDGDALEDLTLPTDSLELAVADNPGDYDGDCCADFLVGAYKENTNKGLVRLYYGDASPADGMAYAEENGSTNNYRFGSTVAYTEGLGVDADGGPDLLVGAHTTTDPILGVGSAGMVHLYQVTSGDSSSLTDLFQIRGGAADLKLGRRLGYMGDVNGDGVGDFAAAGVGGVGDPDESREPYLVLGSWASDLSAAEADAVLKNDFDASNLNLSYKLKGGADFDGDGLDDMFVSGVSIDLGDLSASYWRVFFYGGDSSISGDVDPAAYIWGGGTDFSFMGSSLDIGDIDGDGDADLIVGGLGATIAALGPIDVQLSYGSAFLYLGPSSLDGELTYHDADVQIYSDDEIFGFDVAYVGDVNGDGIGDILVTSLIEPDAPGYPDAKAYLYYGQQEWSSSLTQADAALVISGTGTEGAMDQTIYSGTGLGDINNDGYDDFVIGAVDHTSGDAYAYIFLGQASYSSSTADLSQRALVINDKDFLAAAGIYGEYSETQYPLDDYTPDPESPPKRE